MTGRNNLKKEIKRILLIEEAPLIREYLTGKLESNHIEVIKGINGLDGMIKMRKTDPHLVITDLNLSRKNLNEILKEKAANPELAAIPMILLSPRISPANVKTLARHNIKKIITKPIKIDLLFQAVSEILGITFDMDSTPGIIEAHFNSDILFIEIARGLNYEKIEVLQYKIKELLENYRFSKPRILIIFSDINAETAPAGKLAFLFKIILETTGTPFKMMKVLTTSPVIRIFLEGHSAYKKIAIETTLDKALNDLLGIQVSDFIEEGKSIVKEDFIMSTPDVADRDLQLKFNTEEDIINYEAFKSEINIAVVDDDEFIHGLIETAFEGSNWKLDYFFNGKEFVKSLETRSFDLVFLDLMMPEMNGFRVMEYLFSNTIRLPVIILSALSRTETIEKAISYGIKSYMIKPLDLNIILRKTRGLLMNDF